jgi:glycosyltransferase involved in cell wall biosynthesis
LIVVNDGSTDETPNVLKRYQKKHQFTLINQENQKLPRALNNGFAIARGRFLTWTSSDNIMLPNMLEELLAVLRSNPELGLVYADWQVIDRESNVLGEIRTFDYDPYVLMRTNFINACFLYRRECQNTIGFYDPEYIHAEDWEYWLRISHCFRMARVPLVLYQYRVHKESLTRKKVLTKKDGCSVGYTRLKETFIVNPVKWYFSKLIWEWKKLILRRDLESYFEFYGSG